MMGKLLEATYIQLNFQLFAENFDFEFQIQFEILCAVHFS